MSRLRSRLTTSIRVCFSSGVGHVDFFYILPRKLVHLHILNLASEFIP